MFAPSSSTSSLQASLIQAKKLTDELIVTRCVNDVLFWVRNGTKTRDEQDKANPNKPFPPYQYIDALVRMFQVEPVSFCEKSRTMMATWTICALRAHEGFTTPQTRHIFLAPDERRAINCINYVKWLWENSLPGLKARWKLARRMDLQSQLILEMDNGSLFEALAGGVDKVRSLHPTSVTLDEGAFIPDGAEAFDNAKAAKPLSMAVISSAKPGWFRDATEFAKPTGEQLPFGMAMRRTAGGIAVIRLHYSADPNKRGGWAEREKAGYVKKSNWDLEMEIKYEAKSGALVYPEFDRAIHVVPDSMVPKRGCIAMAADPHPRTPHAFLWVLCDRAGDYWVYRELWPSVSYAQIQEDKDANEHLYTTKDYAIAIAQLEGNRIEWDSEGVFGKLIEDGERIYDRFMDQAGKGFRVSGEGQPTESYWTRYRDSGLVFREPYKIHQAGEDRIHSLLEPRPHEQYGKWPRLHIAASCEELILEFSKHRYKQLADHVLQTKL
jgi:hypothetical protein